MNIVLAIAGAPAKTNTSPVFCYFGSSLHLNFTHAWIHTPDDFSHANRDNAKETLSYTLLGSQHF